MTELLHMSERLLIENLKDPHWRLRNLYYVLDKDGNTVLFQPNEVQQEFLDNIWYRNVIPKARQRGFSTVVQLMILDACLFVPNTGAGIIAQDENTAKSIRNNKIKFAYDHLPQIVRDMVPLTIDNVTELEWANGSFMVVAISTRGRTLQYLHVSEYGKICASAPDKAQEIKSGSLPSVDQGGVIVIESTAEGMDGDFYDKVAQAKAVQESGRKLAKMEYRLHFASWWDADEYETDPTLVTISAKDNAYFERMEGEIGRPISARKRAWYVAVRDNTFSGDQETMWSQYPTTLEEAFQVSSEGVYLKNQLSLARRQERIGRFPYRPDIPVNTFWDLGLNDDMAIWFHQQVGAMDHWIDYEEGSGEPYSYFVQKMQQRGFIWGRHFLPHDGDQRRPGAESLKTPADMLADLGLKNIEIVPRISDVVVGIQQLRDDFASYCFDEVHCAEGIKHLTGYRKLWNARAGAWSPRPAQNGHQHAADAIRQKAQARYSGMITIGNRGPSRPKRRSRSGMAA